MSSQKRIDASRANGTLSRGPKTPEGKARSSRIHDAYAQAVGARLAREDSDSAQERRLSRTWRSATVAS